MRGSDDLLEPFSEEFPGERDVPWERPLGVSGVVDGWEGRSKIWRNVALHERLAPTEARFAPFPETLSPRIVGVLQKRGLSQLYSHQAEAYELATAGRDAVIATPTASGKSLCYNLPVLNALCADRQARALYLFPTKALSRDQETALRALLTEVGLDHGAITYDGDTPGDARRAARERTGLLLTNPDMLHTGILPHHANWARFFANLRYVIIDEVHSYRGVFGSHLSNVMRRLQRVARFHGSNPVFLLASATIGNPQEHASRMIGREVSLVNESGAPTGPRRVMVYNPPIVNAELGIRQSYIKVAVRLTIDLMRAGVSTLVFGQSRNNVEVMLKYLRDRMVRLKMDPNLVHGYRGGYLPETRREIEQRLRDGKLLGVVATNALELGIDIGSLDAVVCAGYPGTVASLWQRFGRGGRRGGESLAILVASSMPLDQYIAQDAHYVLGAPIEHARIDPDNVEVLIQHLKCASFELPFEQGDGFGDVPPDVVNDALGFLTSHQVLHQVTHPSGKTMFHWASDAYPANHVSLRSIGWDNFVVVDQDHDRTIAEMDWRSTHTMLHEQAIYQHEGEQYQVERLDFDNHKAFVRKVKPDYFTNAMTYVRVSVLEQEEKAVLPEASGELVAGALEKLEAGAGEVSVIEKVVGYKKIKFHTHENVGYGEVHLPDMQMHTTAFWVTVPESVVTAQRWDRPTVVDALRGLGHAMHTVASVGLMIDPRDLGHTLGDRSEPDEAPGKSHGGGPGFDPTIFLYDRVPGGVGLSARLFQERESVLRRTRHLLQGCACDIGCPACVGPVIGAAPGIEPTPNPELSRKQVALDLLEYVGITTAH